LFIPDPDPDFLPIPDPGVKKAQDPGSGSATHWSEQYLICGRLMFTVPQPDTKFMESLIFTLYNFGGNQREEFLLIKLFR
jgi:hypothetical protein